MKRKKYFRFILLLIFLTPFFQNIAVASDPEVRHRIIVSSDIGGTDPDDFQSMVHLFVYADTLFDIEGIISSPFGDGRKEHILEVIDEYEKDYPKLLSYSEKYLSPDSLRKITKQGQTGILSPIGYAESTEGSDWIIECAKRDDSRPLHILVWGGIDDLAQALHDAPEILPKLRVYWIGGPNKKWGVNGYQYIAENFPDLWMIESNATYRGWFTGGDQSGEWDNAAFVRTYVKGFGALGDYFDSKKSEVKMGDTPSLARLMYGDPEDPTVPSWGGQYVPAWERPHKIFRRLTSDTDSIEEFGVLELLIPFDSAGITDPYATLDIDRDIPGLVMGDTVKFLFSPKKAARFGYKIVSNIPSLNDKTGSIIVTATPPSYRDNPSPLYANWWTDDPSPELMESGHIGAKTVSVWRVEFLSDFAKRMYRCEYYANTYFDLNTSATHGSINRDLNDTAYLAGSKITLTAVAEDGYEFVKWAGDASGTDATLVVTMDSDKSISAQFDKINTVSELGKKEISVYPTNFNDFITISNLEQSIDPVFVELYDTLGKSVDKYNLVSFRGDVSLDLNALRPGIYFLQISQGSVKYNATLVKS